MNSKRGSGECSVELPKTISGVHITDTELRAQLGLRSIGKFAPKIKNFFFLGKQQKLKINFCFSFSTFAFVYRLSSRSSG